MIVDFKDPEDCPDSQVTRVSPPDSASESAPPEKHLKKVRLNICINLSLSNSFKEA